MKGVSGVPTLKGYFTEANRCILVMETLGENVFDFMRNDSKPFSSQQLAHIGKKLLKILKSLHD